MNESIVTRTRNRKGQPNGVLVAMKLDDTSVGIGWSLCKHSDKFDMARGVRMASGRASNVANKSPRSLGKDIVRFADRCNRYFKGQHVLVPQCSPNNNIFVVESIRNPFA